MSIAAEQPHELIPQTGAAAIWRIDVGNGADDRSADQPGPDVVPETCEMHAWTCIWCSMNPPICGSCRPVTPPCPATGQVHTCACRATHHGQAA